MKAEAGNGKADGSVPSSSPSPCTGTTIVAVCAVCEGGGGNVNGAEGDEDVDSREVAETGLGLGNVSHPAPAPEGDEEEGRKPTRYTHHTMHTSVRDNQNPSKEIERDTYQHGPARASIEGDWRQGYGRHSMSTMEGSVDCR